MVDPKDIPDELIDALLANYQKPDDLLGKNGILEQLTKRVMERALQAEMTYHLGHEKHGRVANATGNTRNGTSKKTLKGKNGSLPIAIPRDRDGRFSRGWWKSIRPTGKVWMIASFRCMPVA